MKRGLIRIYLTLALLTLQGFQAISQCAMCRGAIQSQVSAGDTTMAANLNLGIMYLFFAPYVLLGTLAFFWYRKSKANATKVSSRISTAG